MKIDHPVWANLFKPADKQQAEINELWQQTPLFANIPIRHIHSITEDLSLREFNAGESVFKAGEIGMGAALIVSGSVNIQSNDQILATLGKGDLFGEVALATDEVRTADAVASKATSLIFFMKQDLEDLMKQKPTLAAQLAINLAKILAVRLRESNKHVNG